MKVGTLSLLSLLGMVTASFAVYAWTSPVSAGSALGSGSNPLGAQNRPGDTARTPLEPAAERPTLTPALASTNAPFSGQRDQRPEPNDLFVQVATFPVEERARSEAARIASTGLLAKVLWTSKGNYVVALGPFTTDGDRERARMRFSAIFPGYETVLRKGAKFDAVIQ